MEVASSSSESEKDVASSSSESGKDVASSSSELGGKEKTPKKENAHENFRTPVPFNLWNQKTPPQPDEQTLHSAQAHFEAEATRDAVCLQELTRALDLSMNRLRTVYDGEDVCHRYDDLSECRQRNSYNKQIREAQLNLIREPFDSNLTLLCNARIHSATTLQRLNAKLHFLKRKLTSVPLGVEALGVEEQISQVLTEMEIELGRAISEERAINGSMNNV